MLGLVFDLLHMAAAAIFAVVGIGYDRAEDCAQTPVRLSAVEMVQEAELQPAAFIQTAEGEWVTTDCVSAPALKAPRAPQPPRPATLRL